MCLYSIYMISFSFGKSHFADEFYFKGFDDNSNYIFKDVKSGIEFHLPEDSFEVIYNV